MKKVTYLVALMFALVLISTSCEKDNNSESARLRISKVADNPAMENATVFEYNSEGLLIKIKDEDNVYIDIEYDSKNNPINLKEFYLEGNHFEVHYETNIEWSNEKFIINNGFGNKEFTMNSNKIVKQVNTDNYGTLGHSDYVWYNNDSLKITTFDTNNQLNIPSTHKFHFGSLNSPFKTINVAFRTSIVNNTCFLNDIEFQNDNCMNNSIEVGEVQDYSNETTITYIYETTVTYEGNQSNYPLKAILHYKGSYGTETFDYSEFRYFEYESY
jgi:hypothetical protein